MNIPAEIVKSFTKHPDQGNAAGVVIDADALTDEQILDATNQLGFPESAFLQKSQIQEANFRLRLFSKVQEVKSCVTATLAAASVVAQNLNLTHIVFETIPGIREIFVRPDGLLMMKQPPIEFSQVQVDRQRVTDMLNISESILGELPLEIASAGTPKLLIHIKKLADLKAITPNLDKVAQYCEEVKGRGIYLFTLETLNEESDFHARAMNPQDGIKEDPVTGVAAAALTAYFLKHNVLSKQRIIGEQGYSMNKPGEIIIERDGDIIYVGGYTTHVGQKELAV